MKIGSAVASSLAALAFVVAAGCEKKAPKEIKVGVIQSQTGFFASMGEGALYGIKAAVEDVNRLGGVKVGTERLPIRIVAVNCETDPNKAGSLAESLVLQDHVQFIVSGDEPPPMHPAVSKVCDTYKVPYVTGVGPEEPWTGMKKESPTGWKYTWAMGSFNIIEPAPKGDFRAKPGYTVMDAWLSQLGQFGSRTNKRIGLIVTDDPDGRGWYSLLLPILKEKGYTVVGAEKNMGLLPFETTDFSSVVKAWKDAGIDILWGNGPAPFLGTVLKQARAMGVKPKIMSLGRGALNYDDVNAWGGDLPLGCCIEVWWDGTMIDCPGFGTTTPQTLAEKWVKETHRPVLCTLGPGYAGVQVLADAIERAGSVDPEKVNAALTTTDLKTIRGRIKFNANQFSRGPIAFGQWFKTDKPERWELKVIHSEHAFWPVAAKPLFPIPASE
nr:ABC transporter substrate-binding protein [uncultured Holophaga sp.]